jgi:hypothetical protein
MQLKYVTVFTGTGINWRERKLISTLYMDESVKGTSGTGREDKKCEEWKRS